MNQTVTRKPRQRGRAAARPAHEKKKAANARKPDQTASGELRRAAQAHADQLAAGVAHHRAHRLALRRAVSEHASDAWRHAVRRILAAHAAAPDAAPDAHRPEPPNGPPVPVSAPRRGGLPTAEFERAAATAAAGVHPENLARAALKCLNEQERQALRAAAGDSREVKRRLRQMTHWRLAAACGHPDAPQFSRRLGGALAIRAAELAAAEETAQAAGSQPCRSNGCRDTAHPTATAGSRSANPPHPREGA